MELCRSYGISRKTGISGLGGIVMGEWTGHLIWASKKGDNRPGGIYLALSRLIKIKIQSKAGDALSVSDQGSRAVA